jgi:hypothetical protein
MSASEQAAQSALEKVETSDPHQNSVYMPFLSNFSRRIDKVLAKHNEDNLRRLKAIEFHERINLLGLVGAMCLGAFAAYRST